MWTKIIGGFVIALVLAAGGYYYFVIYKNDPGEALGTSSFICDGEKTIEATFYQEEAELVLGDGRKVSLPQVLAASGVRYTNKDDTFSFSTKGNSAFIEEGINKDKTYSNCEQIVEGQEPKTTFASTTLGFTIKHPRNFLVDQNYVYQFNNEKSINGVKFSIPLASATGTNLSTDTGISVEMLPRANNCTADIYLRANVKASKVNEGGKEYSIASSSEAAAGNRYEEMVFALPGSKPCTALRYFIHSTSVGNYPEGSVREFDRGAIIEQFNEIRDSLTITR